MTRADMSPDVRILFTGSRNHAQYNRVLGTIATLLSRYPLNTHFVLVHGAAKGLDALVGRAARQLQRQGYDVTEEPHPADWAAGKAAGHWRNQHMVNLGADLCVAFPLNGSRGTWDCVARARAAGIRVEVVTCETPPTTEE